MDRNRNIKYYLVATIALMTFLIYLPALRNEFVYWDDNLYIFENPYIRSLDAAFFRWAFLDFHVSNWHPLAWISHAVDYALWELNPLGHHLTSIIIHAINTALVVLLALKLIGSGREGKQQNASTSFLNDRTTLIAAGATGLLFGIHPVHVESVVWVSERKDLLCALFFLLSIMAYVRYADCASDKAHGSERMGQSVERKGSPPFATRFAFFIDRHYLLALCFFILALMSKPMAVTLPVVLLILDWYPFRRVRSQKTLWPAVVEKTPFLILSIASSTVTILAQHAGGALSSIEKIPLLIRIPVAAKSLIAYLGKMLLPLDLVPFYPYPGGGSLFSFEYASAIILAAGVTAACAALARKQKLWLSAWGYFVVTLLPVLGLIQVGGQAMADRYTYLPSLGPFLVAGLCVAWIAEKALTGKRAGLVTKGASVIAALLLVVCLSALTVEQAARWRNSIDLWTYVIENEPERVPIAYNNRGMAFYRTGQFDKAIEDFDRAIKMRPSYIDAYSNLGMAWYQTGRPDRAIEHFDKAIALDPGYYKAYNNRAMALGKMGRFDAAAADYHRAIALNPSSPQAYYNLGVLHAQAGVFDRAIAYFSRALAVDPGYADAYLSRGMAFSLTGQVDSALDDFARALASDRSSAVVHFNRGDLYLKIGQTELALADFQKACDLGFEAGCGMARQMTEGPRP